MKTIAAFVLILARVLAEEYCSADLPKWIGPPMPGDELVHVTVLTRHGDRAPIHTAVDEHDAAWSCDVAETIGFTNVPGDTATPPQHAVVYDQAQESPWSSKFFQGNCSPGFLTIQGARMHTELGAAFRRIYVDKLAFVPAAFDPSAIRLRSTDFPRTRQSGISFMLGLYPEATRKPGTPPLQLHIIPAEVDYVAPNSVACPRSAQLLRQNRHSELWTSRMKALSTIAEKVYRVIGATGKSDWEESFEYPFDVMMTRLCHGIRLPCLGSECITAEEASKIIAEAKWEYNAQFVGDELTKLFLSPLIGEIAGAMRKMAFSGEGPKWLHFSSHDSMVALMLQGLHVTTEKDGWPPYRSHLTLELWCRRQPKQQFLVRVLYNGEERFIADCPSRPCILEDFLSIVKSRLTITDLTRECAPKNVTTV